ncbi:uncharacterized protein LOC118190610 isoform X1 [Stegodyphus dumicola]|uniref:uncharacterized protein LOC118190610 isoform X1 n=1 Tax=Stegodyphus dumicola TaxID=202533 RepID=UPI0015A75F83|nr:uncharacterized protein LOC118190610 isoform X1 [Stegodyphus dumicola]XP_035217250.1 uncharacterized protein LOC118190610 isoform X1 [Stegodyphus dumicola]
MAGTILENENLSAVIYRRMQAHQLRPQDIRQNNACQIVYNRGEYCCLYCHRTWMSNFSWIRVNLKDQRFEYRWKMKCQNCLSLNEPKFTIPQFEELADMAICWYKGEDYTFPRTNSVAYRQFRRPHLPTLCEKCGWGATECWRYVYQ